MELDFQCDLFLTCPLPLRLSRWLKAHTGRLQKGALHWQWHKVLFIATRSALQFAYCLSSAYPFIQHGFPSSSSKSMILSTFGSTLAAHARARSLRGAELPYVRLPMRLALMRISSGSFSRVARRNSATSLRVP